MKKIWIIYASSGTGHKRAAQAVYEAFKSQNLDADVSLVNSLDYTNTIFKWAYPTTYEFLVRYLSWSWGFFYYLLDLFREGSIVFSLRRFSNAVNSMKLVRILKEKAPDVIILTHFFANEVISDMKRGGFKSRTICVVTDYGLHSFWVSRKTDLHVVGSEETKADLVSRGIEPERIHVLGIPVRPVFGQKKDKAFLQEKLKLRKDIFTILIMSGGFGVGPVQELVEKLGEFEIPLQILVVCGNNKKLYEDISKLAPKSKNPVVCYGFVENVDELMTVSDVAVTKSGGLTMAEAMSKRLPLIVVSPIPGQETKNVHLLVKVGAGWQAQGVDEVIKLIKDVSAHPELLIEKRENCRKLSHPDAALKIAALAMEIGTDTG